MYLHMSIVRICCIHTLNLKCVLFKTNFACHFSICTIDLHCIET